MQKYKNSKLQKCKNTKMQKYKKAHLNATLLPVVVADLPHPRLHRARRELDRALQIKNIFRFFGTTNWICRLFSRHLLTRCTHRVQNLHVLVYWVHSLLVTRMIKEIKKIMPVVALVKITIVTRMFNKINMTTSTIYDDWRPRFIATVTVLTSDHRHQQW